MRKKSKLANYLSLAFLGIASLTAACSSGSGSTGTTTNTQESGPITFVGDSAILDWATAKLESVIAGKIASAIFNEVTTGSPSAPPTDADFANQALSNITESLSVIQGQLTGQESLINTIINQTESIQIYQASQGLNYAINNINFAYQGNGGNPSTSDLANWLQNIFNKLKFNSNISGSLVAQFESSLMGTIHQPVNESTTNAILNYYSQAYSQGSEVALPVILRAGTQVGQGYLGNVNLDVYEQEMSCDISPNLITWYTLNDKVNQKNHPTPTLSNSVGCGFVNYLNILLDGLTTSQIQNQSGNNSMYRLYVFNQGLSLVTLKIINSLSQAYAIDQIRLFLYAKNPNMGVPLPAVISPAKVKDYKEAESELKLAYTTRVQFVLGLVNQAELSAYNYYTNQATNGAAGSINNAAMESDCNLSESSLLQLLPGQISATAANATSNNGNLLSWDGQYLATTCKNQRTESGVITTTTNVTGLCQTTNSNYNLYSTNGYVFCGPGYTPSQALPNVQKSNYTNVVLSPTISPVVYSVSPNVPVISQTWLSSNEPGVYTIPNPNGTRYVESMNMYITIESPINWIWNPVQTPPVFTNQNQQVTLTIPSAYPNPNFTNDMSYFGLTNLSWVASGNSWSWNNIAISTIADQLDLGTGDLVNQNQNGWFVADDGTHKFLIGAYFSAPANSSSQFPTAYNPILAVRIQCFTNDVSCKQGIFANSSALKNNSSDYQALVFANGDVITLTQTGRMSSQNINTFSNVSTTSGTGQYQINQYYGANCNGQQLANQVSFPNYTGQTICSNN